MSDFYADTVVVKWIEEYKFPRPGTAANDVANEEDDDILVISVPTAASTALDGPVHWASAVAGLLEVKTLWTPAQESLNDTSVYVEVPGYGPAVLFSGKTIDLKTPQPISVSIPGAGVDGTVQFDYSADKKDIKLDWKLNVPWLGTLDDGRSLFPKERSSPFLANKLQNLKIINDSEVSALMEAPLSKFEVVRNRSGKEMIRFDPSEQDTLPHQVARAFIHDNVGSGDPIVALPVSFGLKSEGSGLDVSFLGIFQLVGTILPAEMGISATLYAKIPFAGRIKLAEFKGSLISGISVKINLALAKGSAVVSAKPNASGKHDLYINLKLKIKFVKEFNTGDIKLFGLPF